MRSRSLCHLQSLIWQLSSGKDMPGDNVSETGVLAPQMQRCLLVTGLHADRTCRSQHGCLGLQGRPLGVLAA
jgi:hypothetical protein